MWPTATDGVAWSVGLSVITVNTTEMAEPIEMSFVILSWVGPRSHVLDVGRYPPCNMQRGSNEVEWSSPLCNSNCLLWSSAKMAEPIDIIQMY